MESTRKGGIHFGLPVVCIIKKLKQIKQLDVHSLGKVAGDLNDGYSDLLVPQRFVATM